MFRLYFLTIFLFSEYGTIWKTKGGDVKKMHCLKTYPTWMKDMKDILGPLRVKDIFLPGTHDSAAYDVNGTIISIISKFAVTQVNTISNIYSYIILYRSINKENS